VLTKAFLAVSTAHVLCASLDMTAGDSPTSMIRGTLYAADARQMVLMALILL